MTRRYNLLVIYDVSYPHTQGGGQLRIWNVLNRLDSSLFDITWLTYKTWHGDNQIELDGIKYVGLENFPGLYNKKGKRSKYEVFHFLYSIIFSKINFSKYDIIWSGQWPMSQILILSYLKFKNKKINIVIDLWEIWGSRWLGYSKTVGFIGLFFEKLTLSYILKKFKIIVISQQSKNYINRQFKSLDVTLINNGYDSDVLYQKNIVKEFDIIYFGRLVNHKNVDHIIRAVAYISKHKNLQLKVLIAGDGPEYFRLVNLAKNLDISELIKFKNSYHSNELCDLINKSKININPSDKDGGGSITVLEAQSCGVPVIIYKLENGVDPTLIDNGKCGVIVNKFNYVNLAEEIFDLLQNSELYCELSRNAIINSREYAWNKITENYLEVFKK